MGWCADYADENNWVHEVFNAEAGANRLRRVAGEFDALTVQAARESDPAVREELYLEAETILAAEETAYAPIYHYTTVASYQTVVDQELSEHHRLDFYNWTIDMDAKLAAQGQ